MKNNFNGEEKIKKMVSLTKKLYKKQPSSRDVEEFIDFVLKNLVEEKEDKTYFFSYITSSLADYKATKALIENALKLVLQYKGLSSNKFEKEDLDLVINYLKEMLEFIIKEPKQKNLFEDPDENMV